MTDKLIEALEHIIATGREHRDHIGILPRAMITIAADALAAHRSQQDTPKLVDTAPSAAEPVAPGWTSQEINELRAEAAGHEIAIGHLSALVDEATILLRDLLKMVRECYDEWGGGIEDGEIPLVDQCQAWVDARPMDSAQMTLAAPPAPQPTSEPYRCDEADCPVCQRYAPQPTEAETSALTEHERELDQALFERDEREEVINAILDEVLGLDRHEWSSAYGFADAIEDVKTRMWASSHPAPSAAEDAKDGEMLDWLLLRISGFECRRIGIHYSGNVRRSDVAAAMAKEKQG